MYFSNDSKYTKLERTANEEKIILEDLKLEKKEENTVALPKPVQKSNISISKKRKKSKSIEENYSTKKKTAIEEIIEEEIKEKEIREMKKREKQEIPWLIENIVIKITSKALGDKYYKQKAEIIQVVNKFKAIVKLIQDSSKIQVDQNQIETVIPAIGKQVIVLRGKYKGEKAILDSLDVENFSAKLKLCDNNGLTVSLPYEHFSKMCSPVIIVE